MKFRLRESWNVLFVWVGKIAHQFVDKHWSRSDQDPLTAPAVKTMVKELSTNALKLERELEDARSSLAELKTRVQETEKLQGLVSELTNQVHQLEGQRKEEIEVLAEFRAVVVHYFRARKPLTKRAKVTNTFNEDVLIGSLEITNQEIEDDESKKDPDKVYEIFLAYCRRLQVPQADST